MSLYLRHHARVTKDPEGDFVKDAQLEIELGIFTRADDWNRLEWHLILRRAGPEAMGAARRVYHRRYLPWARARGSG